MAPTDITQNLRQVRKRIADVCRRFDRNPAEINLLAVSKTKPAELILAAIDAGQTHFGENYVQEALVKMPMVSAGHDVGWHFIGAIQSNKTREIAENFSWVHTVATEKAARRLNDQRPAGMGALRVLLQVNISSEASKAGIAASELPGLLERLVGLEHLELRGLMAIPEALPDFEAQRQPFRELRLLRDEQRRTFGDALPLFSELSMGMSSDIEAAIAEGATWVRVGTAIFGQRDGS